MNFIKKMPVKLFGCFLISILLVLILQLLAISNNDKKNHFIRLFPPHIIKGYINIELDNSHHYFAGIAKGNLFLGNYTNPEQILVAGSGLKNNRKYIIPLPSVELLYPSNLHTSVDSNFLILTNLVTGKIFKFTMTDTLKNAPVIENIGMSVNILLPLSNDRFAVRTYNSRDDKNVLAIINMHPFSNTIRNTILEPQVDGIFSTDGMLRHEAKSGTFIYIYLYRNQIICVDDSLNVKYRKQTLDTNTYAKIKVIHNNSAHASTLASPGFYVNREVCLSQNWIFVNSGVRADNEAKSDFENNAVIDVYSLKDGRYHFSFYLPVKSRFLSAMLINDNVLYTIQNKALFAYTLDLSGIRF